MRDGAAALGERRGGVEDEVEQRLAQAVLRQPAGERLARCGSRGVIPGASWQRVSVTISSTSSASWIARGGSGAWRWPVSSSSLSRRVRRATSSTTRSTRSLRSGIVQLGAQVAEASSGFRPADCAARARPRRPARRWRPGARRAPGCAAARAAGGWRRAPRLERRGARAVDASSSWSRRASALNWRCSGRRNGSTCSSTGAGVNSPSARRASWRPKASSGLMMRCRAIGRSSSADGQDGQRRRQLEAELRAVLALERAPGAPLPARSDADLADQRSSDSASSTPFGVGSAVARVSARSSGGVPGRRTARSSGRSLSRTCGRPRGLALVAFGERRQAPRSPPGGCARTRTAGPAALARRAGGCASARERRRDHQRRRRSGRGTRRSRAAAGGRRRPAWLRRGFNHRWWPIDTRGAGLGGYHENMGGRCPRPRPPQSGSKLPALQNSGRRCLLSFLL